jgi:hypothetical protein
MDSTRNPLPSFIAPPAPFVPPADSDIFAPPPPFVPRTAPDSIFAPFVPKTPPPSRGTLPNIFASPPATLSSPTARNIFVPLNTYRVGRASPKRKRPRLSTRVSAREKRRILPESSSSTLDTESFGGLRSPIVDTGFNALGFGGDHDTGFGGNDDAGFDDPGFGGNDDTGFDDPGFGGNDDTRFGDNIDEPFAPRPADILDWNVDALGVQDRRAQGLPDYLDAIQEDPYSFVHLTARCYIIKDWNPTCHESRYVSYGLNL